MRIDVLEYKNEYNDDNKLVRMTTSEGAYIFERYNNKGVIKDCEGKIIAFDNYRVRNITWINLCEWAFGQGIYIKLVQGD